MKILNQVGDYEETYTNANGLMTYYRLAPCQTSMMKLFVKIFHDFRPFTINTTYELTIYWSLKQIKNTKRK